ncbi:hypothetical protein A4X13_0g9172 [Tilletia indica]|uniref:Uncharacterized protein n=1 Tax=Tilletia indica TaxID=43049 RepID=A0A8T8SB07_9BASI|nr:hypothetical protein A4X13_0g9172 [Tilletia indica]
MIVQRAALVLIVEGILTAIPTVLAVNLPIGAEQSAKRKALGIHTAPTEKIPVVTILYSDKTSTVKTNKITIDPETGILSSKGQAHQRRDHPRLRVSAWNREPIPSIRGVGTGRSSVEPRDSTVSLTEIALALFASYILEFCRSRSPRVLLLPTLSLSRIPSTVLSSACRVSTAQRPIIPTAPTTSPGSTS